MKNTFFLDWTTQPKSFKNYPHFFKRYKISDFHQLKDLELISSITYKKDYPTGEYSLRTVPSAGGLYPCEIYIQIRGIKGIISGIYHYEVENESLCLLKECEKDGVEHYFKDNSIEKGFIFLISSIYFRSSWKYNDRSIRYILLDTGHQLGAIYSALCVMGKDSTIKFDFDKLLLNEIFGFREDEFFMSALSATEKVTYKIDQIKNHLPYVCGSDYLETNQFIYESYKKSTKFTDEDISNIDFFNNTDKTKLKKSILNRRSIRAFEKIEISKDQFKFIIKGIFNFAKDHNIEIYYTLHRVTDMKKGLYKNEDLVKEDDFKKISGHLALDQKLGSDSAVTFYFTSNEEIKYQKVNILSGFIAHIIYIKAELENIGCSGIGAYYDKEVKEFLGTKNNILYMLSIGK